MTVRAYPLPPLVASLAVALAGSSLQGQPVQLFPLDAVTLDAGPFARAQSLNREYLLAHDVDRFLAPFLREAGLPPKAEPYPNWESTGLDGHSAGHYLTALAQAVATSSHPELSQRLHYMVAELARVQAAHGDGYVGGVPGSRKAWEAVARGQLEISNFSVNGLWVPWYNLHKTFAGLRDTWVLTANAQARDVFVGLSDWCVRLTAQLSDTQMQDMLRAEHGGMNEVLADAFAITGDRRYLEAAARFSHRAVLDPLLRKEDRLTGLHANTQIPKVIGFARIAELGGDASGWDAARFFWETVVQRRSVAFGGNSVREHFNAPDDFHSMLESREGPETCNTYNMLRLSEQLFRHEPAARYVDYYERAHFNHLLSSQHPEHGGLVYFTPIRPQHYRVYSQPNVCFWCCVGSGMETHGKHGRFVYAHDAESLYVNLFVASTLRWPERGLTLRQETAFPEAPRTVLHLDVEQPQRLTLRVRHPSWVRENEFAVTVNGEPWPMRSSPSSFVALTRDWRKGDRIEVSLPMHTTVEPLPDGSDYVALLHGPLVLAAKTSTENLDGLIADDARMGHIAPGRYEPLARSPMLVGDREKLADAVRPVQGQPLTFTAADLLQPPESRDLELIPFYRVHDARYMIYWRTTTPAGYAEVVRAVAAEEQATLALAARTLDQVTPGEQQPEVEHDLRAEDSRTGHHLGRLWRDAGEWFSYTLDPRGEPNLTLLVTYSAGERDRRFRILVNEQEIAAVELNGRDPDRFVDVAYPLPPALVATPAGKLTVTFTAAEKSRTGSIYGVRLIRSSAE